MGGLHGLRVEVAHITFDSVVLTAAVPQPPQPAEPEKRGLALCPRKERERFGEQRAVFWYIPNP